MQALDDVDLAIESGEFFTLLGPSGCGKTTLLRTVAGFIHQDSGEVRVAGQRIDDMPAYRRNIGLVFQDYAIFPHMTVGDNVAFGLQQPPPPAAGDRRTRGAARSNSCVSAATRRACRTNSRAASSSAWAWRARWSSSRRSC